ncbi:MAG: PAS domain S-box protein, partial [Alphaproteobacteria bacterium]|nr:PAS domain S-box protein [Alphaproteobacteria bacterium]
MIVRRANGILKKQYTDLQDNEQIINAKSAALENEVAEREKAHEALRKSEEQFRDLIRGSIQGVLIHREGKPLFANQALADIFGYDGPEEILALPSVGMLKAKSERERLAIYSTARMQHGSPPVRYEFEGVQKDGTHIWLENFVTLVVWNGESAIQSTSVNITERKHLQQELDLRLAQVEMAQMAYERQGEELAAMAETLTNAYDQVEAANRTKSEFLANMSHELRTPLSAILGFSELMGKATFGPLGNPKYEEYTKDINDSGRHLLALIDDILDISKIEAGRLELDEEDIDIARTTSSCMVLVKERAGNGGVTLKTDIPEGLPALHADQRMLKQILVNLLSNAVKFTQPGGEVTLKAWSRPDSGYV